MAASKKTKNPVVPFISGGIAGIAEISVTMPLDTIKTQMQLRADAGSAVSTARGILSTHGPRGLYFGMSAMVTQVSCKAAIRFTAFEQLKFGMKLVAPDAGDVQTNFVCGIGAGIAEAALWVTPTERLKVLRQAEVNAAVPKYNTLTGAVRTVVAEQGVRGLFVGFVPTAARQGMAMGVRFVLYDIVKKQIAGERKATPIESLAAGMATGTISSLLNQPLDMAKSRLQAQDKASGAAMRYTGTLQTLMLTMKEEGIMSWYRGCVPRVARLTIGQGIIFSVQEHIAEALRSVLG